MNGSSLLRPGSDWFARDPLEVALSLLGAELRVADDGGAVVVRLTEVEAYHGSHDPGSHAYRGATARNATMFGPGGFLYVYFTYGMHHCANVVCGRTGEAAAVLLRAGEVVEGAEIARGRRPTARRDVDLARGPARLCAALGLSKNDDGVRIGSERVSLRVPAEPPRKVLRGPRVGVAGPGGAAESFPWRFWLPEEPTVSVYRPALPTRRGRNGTRAAPTRTRAAAD